MKLADKKDILTYLNALWLMFYAGKNNTIDGDRIQQLIGKLSEDVKNQVNA